MRLLFGGLVLGGTDFMVYGNFMAYIHEVLFVVWFLN